MKRVTLLGALLLGLCTFASANVITFDEFPAENNNTPITNLYASEGVTFDSRNSGTWDGLAKGDPGNWGVNGTNGEAFLGQNGVNNNNTFAESIFFATGQSMVSFDASRTNGSSPGQMLTADAYDAMNHLLATETLTLGDINSWSTFTMNGAGIVRLDIIGSINGSSPYAVDNLQFTSVPEPGTLVMLGSGLATLAGVYRRYRR